MPSLTFSTPRIEPKQRLAVLDELKGVALILVILYHAGGVLGWRNILHFEVGVDIFVIISGIGLAMGSSASSVGSFLLRRGLRIFPTYWMTLGLILLLNYLLGNRTSTTTDIVLHALGIHGFLGDTYFFSINDSFWFISLILGLYLCFLLVRRWLDKPDKLLLAGALISAIPTMLWFYNGQSASFSHFGIRLPGFFIGLMIGSLLKSGGLTLTLNWRIALFLLALIYVPYTQGVIFISSILGLAVGLAYVTALHPLINRSGQPGLIARTLRFLGDHSLEIFLIHQPMIRNYNIGIQMRWIDSAVPNNWRISAGMAIALMATILLSVGLKKLTTRLLPQR